MQTLAAVAEDPRFIADSSARTLDFGSWISNSPNSPSVRSSEHRIFPFRGVIFDVDPVFANTEEWWLAIPEAVRPRKDQPFYHLLAESDQSSFVAYVSEQNLLPELSDEPVGHPQAELIFNEFRAGRYQLRPRITH